MLSFRKRSAHKAANGRVASGEGDKVIDGVSAIQEIFIPRDTRITGSIETRHKIRLEDQVYGPLTALEVVVENEATVEGAISATDVILRGRVKGSLRAKTSISLRPAKLMDTWWSI